MEHSIWAETLVRADMDENTTLRSVIDLRQAIQTQLDRAGITPDTGGSIVVRTEPVTVAYGRLGVTRIAQPADTAPTHHRLIMWYEPKAS